MEIDQQTSLLKILEVMYRLCGFHALESTTLFASSPVFLGGFLEEQHCASPRAVQQELLAKKLASRKAVLQAKRIKQETSKDPIRFGVFSLFGAVRSYG